MAGTTIVVTPPCPVCDKESTYALDTQKVMEWQMGALIQNVFPEMTPAQRETLINGTHDECFEQLYGSEGEPERCVVCGSFVDYCLGHGPIGDPLGFGIQMCHDEGDHGGCNPLACEARREG